MIYDFLVSFGRKHPNILRGLIGTAAYVIFGYIALSVVTGTIVEGSRDGCERLNATRLAEYREKEKLISGETRKQTAEEAKGEREKAQGSLEIIQAYEAKQQALVKIAEGSGNQTTEGSVTINCIKEWPKPLSIGGD